MDTIGLIAAMSSESNALLRQLQGGKRIAAGSFRGVRFQIAQRDCVLVTSGMGVRRAAAAARVLIETLHPACLLSFGIAGALREDLKIGDVILATHNCTLEKGRLGPFQLLATLSGAARETVEQALRPRGARFLLGTSVTTRGSQLVLQPPQGLLNPVLEMETAGILPVAEESGIPLVVLRSVSDGPLAPLPFDLGTVMDEDYNLQPGRLLLAVLKHPRLLLQSGRMLKNSRIAADNAAIAVAAVLGQLLPLISN